MRVELREISPGRGSNMAISMGVISRMILYSLIFIANRAVGAASIGVNYGRIADNLPSSNQVVQLLVSQNIDKVKIYDANAEFLQALANSGVSVMMMVPNELIQSIASSPSQAQVWINSNVLPYLPNTKITTIMVGNEILTGADPTLIPQLLPAMKNLYNSLEAAGLAQRIKITTPHALNVLDPNSSFPPSSGAFQPSLASSVMQPLLDFLAQTQSVFMLDVYPYFAYKADNGQHISLDYALFGTNSTGQDDPNTGLHYFNLFDAQMDAVYSAMSKLNHSDLQIVVSETGWPSAGAADDLGATLDNAAAYNRNLLRHVLANPPPGTPLKPGVAIDTYIFELFNEDLKPGDLIEKNFGLFYPNMTKVTYVSFSVDGSTSPGISASNAASSNKRLTGHNGFCLLCLVWCMEQILWNYLVLRPEESVRHAIH
ncbi:hypothetical protein O6H91_11G000200 [Diphasiastrum complanatum]|uniref:Uncharacterized protein n=1 Tax=Diphasiastrum complanatum TaxID=34168 RepID=A0ACC2C5M9_DIPCM|nr:hypothetical protein O6H91_11G000200 [Diphasiastrum complanatum]